VLPEGSWILRKCFYKHKIIASCVSHAVENAFPRNCVDGATTSKILRYLSDPKFSESLRGRRSEAVRVILSRRGGGEPGSY
jgi:hypothetical protein